MKLSIVGCSGSYAGPDSPASSYLVEADDASGRTWRILLDLGSGAIGALHRLTDPLSIDAVFLTHLHPDHFFDISGLHVLWKYSPLGRPGRIPVFGPSDAAERCASSYGLPLDPGMTQEFDFRLYDEATPARVGPFAVSAARVEHPVEAYGLRVAAGGASLAYSGDTGLCDALVDLARDTDLLLAEASMRDGDPNPPALHMTGSEAGEAARRSGARQLLLTHIPPWHSKDDRLREAKGVFGGPLELARPEATYTL